MGKGHVFMISILVISMILSTLTLDVSSLAQGEGKKIRVVTKEISLGKIHPGIVVSTFTVSPDIKRMAYMVRRGSEEFVVVDGKEGSAYDAVGSGSLRFSPDSRRLG